MSIGLELIRAIIEAGDADAARLLRPAHFTSNEREAADFFLGFYRDHGAIPSERVMRRHGHRLPHADGPVTYCLQRLRQRSMYIAISDHRRAFGRAMSAGDMDAAAAAVAAMSDGIDRARVSMSSDFAITNAPALLAENIPPVQFVVPGLIPVGLTLIAGKPKSRKSYLCVDLCHAVSTGTEVLGRECNVSDVLYICLEGGRPLLQQRIREVSGDEVSPNFDLRTEFPPLKDGGLELLRDWLSQHRRGAMVVIDTFAHVRTPTRSGTYSYWQDVDDLRPLSNLAHEFGAAIVVVHHCKKAATDDPLDEISGSTGLAATPDSLLVLKKDPRDRDTAFLYSRSRNAREMDIALAWSNDDHRFTVVGDADEYRRSGQQQLVMTALQRAARSSEPIMSRRDIADETGIPYDSVGVVLMRLVGSNDIVRRGTGRYSLARIGRVPDLEDHTDDELASPWTVRHRSRPVPAQELDDPDDGDMPEDDGEEPATVH